MEVDGLGDLLLYEYRAKAVNLIGESEASITMTVVIQDDEGMSSTHLDLFSTVLFGQTGVSTEVSVKSNPFTSCFKYVYWETGHLAVKLVIDSHMFPKSFTS